MADLDPDNLSQLKVTELKAELKKRGLPVAGLKQALIDRLRDHLLEQQQEQTEPKSPTPAPQEDEVVEDAPAQPEPAEKESATVKEPEPEAVPEAQPAPESPDKLDQDASGGPEEKDAAEPTPMEVEEKEPDSAPAEVESSKAPEPEREPTPAPPTETEQEQEKDKSPAPAPESVTEPASEDPQPEATTAESVPESVPEQAPAPTAAAPATDEDTPMADAPAATLQTDETPVVVSTDEAMEIDPADTLKRKRRSSSLPPSPTAIAVAAANVKVTTVEPAAEEEEEDAAPTPKKARTSVSPPRRTNRDARDARFKNLFNDSAERSATDDHHESTGITGTVEDDDEEPVPPSLHPATRALYIRNFVRPLHETSLRKHITLLATHGEETPDHDPIELFFLDSIKSHALLVFTSLTEATRVRVGMHGKVFPNERNRKSLWADFVPEEKVAGWIEREKEKARGTGRWEVYYDTSGEEIACELVEAGTGVPAAVAAKRASVDISGAPSGPRRLAEAGAPRKRIVMDLDQLFKSTRTKPKLYYLPVDPEVAVERLRADGRDETGRR